MPVSKQKTASSDAPHTAVIYARYSSYNQSERSIEGQIEDCIAYANRKGYQIIGQYIDRARSGTETEHRQDFQRMIADSARRQFQTVIVWKLDRFSRNRYDFAVYKYELSKNGVTVESINEPTASEDDPSGVIVSSLLEGMAEYYSRNLSQNVKRGLRVARSRGTYTGGILPYGYTLDADRHVILDPVEAPIMQDIFRKYAAGVRMRDIVKDLNDRGLKPRLGFMFTNSSLQHALCNTKYVGRYEYGGEEFPDMYPRLIDDETFLAVQARKDAVSHSPAAGSGDYSYLLSGKAFCGHCGSPLVGESGKSKNGNIYHYYACSSKKKKHTCQKKNERAEDLEYDVVTQTLAYVRDPATLDRIAAQLSNEYKKAFPASEIQTLENTVRRLDKEINNCMELMISGTIDPRLVQRLNEKAILLQAQKDDAERDLRALRISNRRKYTEDDYRRMISEMTDGDPNDPDFRRQLVQTFVNAVYVFDDKLLVYYNVDEQPPVNSENAKRDFTETNHIPKDTCSDLISGAPPENIKSEHIILKSEIVFGFLFPKIKTKRAP